MDLGLLMGCNWEGGEKKSLHEGKFTLAKFGDARLIVVAVIGIDVFAFRNAHMIVLAPSEQSGEHATCTALPKSVFRSLLFRRQYPCYVAVAPVALRFAVPARGGLRKLGDFFPHLVLVADFFPLHCPVDFFPCPALLLLLFNGCYMIGFQGTMSREDRLPRCRFLGARISLLDSLDSLKRQEGSLGGRRARSALEQGALFSNSRCEECENYPPNHSEEGSRKAFHPLGRNSRDTRAVLLDHIRLAPAAVHFIIPSY